MLIAVYSLRHVTEGEIWVYSVLVCALLYVGACCMSWKNRSGRGMKKVMLALLAAEVIYDGACAAIFYPGGEYHNYGLGGAYGALLLWPGLLCFAWLTVAVINAKE